MNPKYQSLIQQARDVLPEREFTILEGQVRTWATYAEIKHEFNNRPDDVGTEEMIYRLSQQYHYSRANINKIIYLL